MNTHQTRMPRPQYQSDPTYVSGHLLIPASDLILPPPPRGLLSPGSEDPDIPSEMPSHTRMTPRLQRSQDSS